MTDPLRHYYAQRAREYEQIYYRDDPQRQLEQLQLAAMVGETALGREVLEIACGTGYWTQFADRTAQQITALDANTEVLDIAAHKGLTHTRLVQGDAYAPPTGHYTAGMALCWLSHVPSAKLGAWLGNFHAALQPRARVLLADNVYIEGVGGVLTESDEAGDTYKIRTLESGESYRILKNYFTVAELWALLLPYTEGLEIHEGECFWWARYTVRGSV